VGVALAAGNIYSLLDGLAAAPARPLSPRRVVLSSTADLRPARRARARIEVIVPPLHHRVVTARVRSPVCSCVPRAHGSNASLPGSSGATRRRRPGLA
jgi:hypothetical protein